MMNSRQTRFFSYLLASSFALTSLHAEADGKDRAKRHDRKHRERPSPAELFMKFDVDESNTLDLEEFSKNPRLENASEEARTRLFQRLDKNSDGVLTQEELKPPGNRGGKRVDEWLEEKGPLTLEEFRKLPRVSRLSEAEQEKLFQHLDRNDDGTISKRDGDLPRRHRRRSPERNENEKKVDFDRFKFRRAPMNLSEERLREMFVELDLNEDGFISPEERMESHKSLEN